MSLADGTHLGAYEITGQIGAGGMGEVYRATDSKLGRDVAIKTLPAALASDSDRLARFEREAKLLAALNHPHIASIYSLDDYEGTLYLAMELVEGKTLEEQLKPGALPVEDALRLALQIAGALEAAHEKGVVHRDLKPANVMVTADGVVKVLDFGLAKAFANEVEGVAENSPALSLAMTQQGLVLGTAGYMSPEQASAQPTDQRADIWSFGVVVYEMLTGLPLFSGESVPHILADVLKTEPDWTRLPKNLHPRIKFMLERCLEKKPRNRYHSIADARVDIERVLSDPAGALLVPDTPVASKPQGLIPWLVAMLSVILAASTLIMGRGTLETDPQVVTRFVQELPPGELWYLGFGAPGLAVSRDGRWLLYPANEGLLMRSMDALDPILTLQANQAVHTPLASPDGEAIAYVDFPSQELRTIAVTGGAPVTVARNLNRVYGASWAADWTIFYALSDGIYRVPADGGDAHRVIETPEGQQAFGPQLLPDGDSLLFSIAPRGDWDAGEIVVESLSTGDRQSLISGGSSAKYVRTGHIVYAFGEDIYAVAFDPTTLSVSGRARRVVEGVMRALSLWQTGVAQYDVSSTGTLAYMTSQQVPEHRVLSVDRNTGLATPLGIQPRTYSQPRISPDGTRLILNEGNVENDIWVWNFASGTPTLLALGSEGGDFPAWTHDSERIAYHPSYLPLVDWRAANNAGTPERLIDGRPDGLDPYHPEIFDPNGRYLIMRGRATRGSSNDLALITLGEQPELEWILQGAYSETQPSVSPNGRWIAYASNESQRSEIYVRPFPNVDDEQISITSQGGTGPVWSGDGAELFYIEPGPVPRLVAVAIDTAADTLELGERTVIMDWPYRADEFNRQYDVSPDGQRFIALEPLGEEADESKIFVVENWFEELTRLVPIE